MKLEKSISNFRIALLMDTYIVDNKIYKERSAKTLSALEVNSKVENLETIAIQYEDEVDIYCTEERRKELNIDKALEIFDPEERDKIRIHTEKTPVQY